MVPIYIYVEVYLAIEVYFSLLMNRDRKIIEKELH